MRQCSPGNLLEMPALMVEFDESHKVPEKAEQNLKERNFITWCEFTAQGWSRTSKGVGVTYAEEIKVLEGWIDSMLYQKFKI